MWCTNAEQTAVWKKLEDGTYVYEHCVKGGERMNIIITCKESKPHALYLRVCPVCGKRFMRFHKARKWCSTRCRDIEFHERYFDKEYRGRAQRIRRQVERREKMLKELPRVKQAMANGDECLLQYLLDTFNLANRNPKKGRRKHEG